MFQKCTFKKISKGRRDYVQCSNCVGYYCDCNMAIMGNRIPNLQENNQERTILHTGVFWSLRCVSHYSTYC